MNNPDDKKKRKNSFAEQVDNPEDEALAMVFGMGAGGLLDADPLSDVDGIAIALAREEELKRKAKKGTKKE